MAQQNYNHTRIPQRPSDHMTGFIHDSKLHPNHSTTARFESITPQTLSPNLIYGAMRKVIIEHPRLSVAYVRTHEKSGHERHAVRLHQLDLRECISFIDSPKIQPNDVLEEHESQWFNRNSLLPEWRLVILNGEYVIFLFNHLCCDGLSTMAFYRSLADSLNATDVDSPENLHFSTIVEIPEVQPVESPFAKFERDTAMIFMVGNAIREIFRTALVSIRYRGQRHICHDFQHSKYQRRCGDEVMSIDNRYPSQPKYEKVTISSHEMTQLIGLCKENGATFTGLLHTLIVGVLSSYIYPRARFARSRIAVSYRRYTATPDSIMTDEVGNIYWGKRLTNLRGVFKVVDPEQIWQVIWSEARKYKDYVKDDLNDEKKHAKINGHAKFMGQTDEKITKTMGLLGRQRHRTLEISNLGVFSRNTDTLGDSRLQDSEVWKITGYSFNSAPSHRSFGSSIAFGVVSIEGGDCEINMGYDGCAIDEHLMEHFANLLQQKLSEFSERERKQADNTCKETL